MPRSLVCLTYAIVFLVPISAVADTFDQYTNRDLANAVDTKLVREVNDLSVKMLSEHGGVLRGTPAAMLIVRTGDNRLAKLLVHPARQKVGDLTSPIVLIERFVTFRDGTERAVQASGQNVQLYPGLQFNLDLGQVVPPSVGGDIEFPNVLVGTSPAPLLSAGKAKIFLVTKTIPVTAAPKAGKVLVGELFETRYFNGTFKLHDDGRRSGTLSLQVNAAGEVSGSFYSDRDGEKYDVSGKVGNPRHAVQFTIKFPRVEQSFTGHLFTGDARALAGTSRLQDREAAFYAIRVED